MKLSDQQALFTLQITALINLINTLPGNRLRDGDCYRDKRCSYGHDKSLHRIRLARDLILDLWDEDTQRWVYQTETEAYKGIGMIWKLMHPLNCWVGILMMVITSRQREME